MGLIGLFFSLMLAAPNSVKPVMDNTAAANMASHVVQREDRAALNNAEQEAAHLFSKGAEADRAKDELLERAAYLKDWASARKIQWESVNAQVQVRGIHWASPTMVRIYGADMARYQYRHLSKTHASGWFGLGIVHHWTFEEVQGRWYIASDKFIDPLNQNTRLPGSAVPAIIQIPAERRQISPSPGAQAAIRYAESYCGAAPGCGNRAVYHPDYEDFTHHGGDCSNFISQVLRAGGFQENSRWSWNSQLGGSDAWINATRLAQYLKSSGRGTVFAAGPLETLVGPDESGVEPLSRLRPGDLIGYFENGRVVHFAVVAGFDGEGYPLVISHSADRYRVPWDLGWDRSTLYLLYHIHYPDSSGAGSRPRPGKPQQYH